MRVGTSNFALRICTVQLWDAPETSDTRPSTALMYTPPSPPVTVSSKIIQVTAASGSLDDSVEFKVSHDPVGSAACAARMRHEVIRAVPVIDGNSCATCVRCGQL